MPRKKSGRKGRYYEPVLPASPYWVDGILLDGELRNQVIKNLLEAREPLSSSEDSLHVVILNNLILLFRLVNFYLPFIDRPEFLGWVANDMRWAQCEKEGIQIITRYKTARLRYNPQLGTMPPDADPQAVVLCGLIDNYIIAENDVGPRPPQKWTDNRAQYCLEVRDAWNRALKTDVKAILNAAPDLPGPAAFPDWLSGMAGPVDAQAPARGMRRSRSPPRSSAHRQQRRADQQRRYRSRSPLRPNLELPVRPSPSIDPQRAMVVREQGQEGAIRAAREREEEARAREEAVRQREEAVRQREEAIRQREAALRQRHERENDFRRNTADAAMYGDAVKRILDNVNELMARPSLHREFRFRGEYIVGGLITAMEGLYDIAGHVLVFAENNNG